MQTATIELRDRFFVTGAEHAHAKPNTKSMAQKYNAYVREAGADGYAAWEYPKQPRKTLSDLGINIKFFHHPAGGQRSIEFADGSYYSHPHWQM